MPIVTDVINVMAAYQPVVQVCCTRWRKEHVGAIVGILIVLILLFYNCVHQFRIIKKSLEVKSVYCAVRTEISDTDTFRLTGLKGLKTTVVR